MVVLSSRVIDTPQAPLLPATLAMPVATVSVCTCNKTNTSAALSAFVAWSQQATTHVEHAHP